MAINVNVRKHTQTITDLRRWLNRNRYIVWRDASRQPNNHSIAKLSNMIDDHDWQTRTYTLDEWESAIDSYLHSISKESAS
jgi:hypothetical protein